MSYCFYFKVKRVLSKVAIRSSSEIIRKDGVLS
jgi:hypothetical protein